MTGKRILIVKDQFLVAWTIADMVKDRGGTALGPVPSVEQALKLIGAEVIDGAILNVTLRGGEDLFPVADALERRRIPFVFATRHDALPDRFAAVRHFSKPAARAALFDGLEEAISSARPAT